MAGVRHPKPDEASQEIARKHAAATEREYDDTSSEPSSVVVTDRKEGAGKQGCLIAGICILAFLGIIYPPFFLGALMIALFAAALKYLTK